MCEGSWILADDHPAFRFGLRLWLEHGGMTIAGEVGTIAELADVVRSVQFDGIVLDVTFPDGDGLDALTELRRASPSVKVLVVSSHDDAFTVQRARRLGVNGFVAKEVDPAVLVQTACAILAGRPYATLVDQMPQAELTARELEVVALVARGATNPQIAHELEVSAETVKSYLQSAFTKLGVSDRTSAAVRARDLHLIT